MGSGNDRGSDSNRGPCGHSGPFMFRAAACAIFDQFCMAVIFIPHSLLPQNAHGSETVLILSSRSGSSSNGTRKPTGLISIILSI